jgi:hypothetical protein
LSIQPKIDSTGEEEESGTDSSLLTIVMICLICIAVVGICIGFILVEWLRKRSRRSVRESINATKLRRTEEFDSMWYKQISEEASKIFSNDKIDVVPLE